MTEFERELGETETLLKNPLVTKDLAKAYARSVAWVGQNGQDLERHGWTVARLYMIGALSFPYSEWGPGWLTLWNNEKCEPRLDSRGNIEFVLHEAGGRVIQTCWCRPNFLS